MKLSPAQIRLLRRLSDSGIAVVFHWDTARSLQRLGLAEFLNRGRPLRGPGYSDDHTTLRITEAGKAALKDL